MNNSSESTNKATSTGCAGTDRKDYESGTATESQTTTESQTNLGRPSANGGGPGVGGPDIP